LEVTGDDDREEDWDDDREGVGEVFGRVMPAPGCGGHQGCDQRFSMARTPGFRVPP
jgi:hypothetical protein